MAILLNLPEELEADVRASAERATVTLSDWLRDAARMKLAEEETSIAALADSINADPLLRQVLDRLAE